MNLASVHNIDNRVEIRVQAKMKLVIEIPKNKI